MAPKESQSARGEASSLLNLMPGELATMGKRRIDEFLNVQSELFDKLQETNRQWLDRAQSEANLASEFASKLSAARSIPDAMIVCQEWTARRFELMAEDGKHLVADAQKLVNAGARLMSNGWLHGNGGAGT